MADNKTVLVGTVGQGVMRSGDGGENWQRVGINQGLHSDALVRTIAATHLSFYEMSWYLPPFAKGGQGGFPAYIAAVYSTGYILNPIYRQ